MKLLLLLPGLLFSFFPLTAQNHNLYYFNGNPSDSIEIMNRLNTAKEVYRTQSFDSVVLLSETILTRSLEVNFARGIGESYFLKARGLNRLGRRDKAIEMYETALEYFNYIDDHTRLASTYNNLGLLLKTSGNFRDAIEAGENALEQVSLTSDIKLKFHILNNLGNSYQSLALFRKASSVYFQSLHLLKTEQDSLYRIQMQAEVRINLGLVYFKQRLFTKALNTFHEARIILENQTMEPQLATTYFNLGFIYAETHEFNTAEYYLHLAQNLNSKLNNKIGAALCRRSFGRISFSKKLYQAAIADQLAAINELEQLNALAYLPFSYLGLGETYLAIELPDQAELALLKGLQIALKSGQKVEELKTYEGLIDLYKSQDQLEKALMYYDIYSALSKELNDQQIGRFIGQLELKELLDKRDLELQSMESQAALLNFKVSRKNVLLILSLTLLIFMSGFFSLIFRQQRLKSFNKSITLEQRMLRAQLNPHFIFNALGAIQHFINNHAPEKAARYLTKFSKLMRTILESSRIGMTSLSTELDTMKNYLDLQCLRFSKPFEYSIEMDDALEPDLIEVPSLIIQPLLENAVEHGLLPNDGGEIKISINQIDDSIRILVDDNGVGLIQSGQPDRAEEGSSGLGTTITLERLSLLNRKYRKSIQFDISNRSSFDTALKGTRTSLTIPII